MPKKLHRALARQAAQKGLTGEAKDRYVYGAMHRIEKQKGRGGSKKGGK